MSKPTPFRILIPLAFGLLTLVIAFTSLSFQPAVDAATEKSRMPIDRVGDPVALTGSNFGSLTDVPINELALYSFDGSAWQAIPFQIDEITAAGQYTTTGRDTDDGGMALFDSNDELVFMARDAGVEAGTSWVADPIAEVFERFEVEVVDPLNGDMAYAYLYRSESLMRSPDNYVAWNGNIELITAISYTADLNSTSALGIADLTLNGTGIDILDRQKLFVSGVVELPLIGCLVPLPIPFSVSESDLATPDPIEVSIVGPVRLISGDETLRIAAYGSRFDISAEIDVDGAIDELIPACDVDIDVLRNTFNWTNPATTGLDRYYDSNGTVAIIDGSADSVPGSPLAEWVQLGGAAAPNVGGLIIALTDVGISGNTTNFYSDNSSNNMFGEFGVQATNLNNNFITLSLAGYILPQNSTGIVGDTYNDQLNTPLQATATAESNAAGADQPIAFVSLDAGGTVAGVSYSAADLLAVNTGSGTWGMYVDASNLGIDSAQVNGVERLPTGDIVVTFAGPTTVPGLVPGSLNPVACGDVVRYNLSRFGSDTTASAILFGFDGSDVELDSECVDAVSLGANLNGLFSTADAFDAQGLTGSDTDIWLFNSAQYGPETNGAWSLFVDGSASGLADFGSEDIDALYYHLASTEFYLSSEGALMAGGVMADDNDVVRCTLAGCTLYLDGDALGLSSGIDGLSVDLSPATRQSSDATGLFE